MLVVYLHSACKVGKQLVQPLRLIMNASTVTKCAKMSDRDLADIYSDASLLFGQCTSVLPVCVSACLVAVGRGPGHSADS